MRKTLKNDHLAGRPAARALLALSLTASLAAFGCTTNRTPGNGEPLSGAPGVRGTSPTSGANTGSSSGSPAVNPSMTSSSNYSDPQPAVSSRSRKLPLSPDEAAAVLAGNGLDRRVRVLGPSDPARSGRAYASDSVTGQFENPALKIAPIVTINSSVNSAAHVPAVISGAGSADVAGITAASTVSGTNAATVLSPSAAAATPTSAGLPFSPGSFAAGPGSVTAVTPGVAATNASTGTLTPTAASAAFPVPTVAGSSITAATGTVRAAGATAADAVNTAATTGTVSTLGTTNTGTTATTGTAAATTTTNAATTNAARAVRVTQDASGRVIVSNATSKDKQ